MRKLFFGLCLLSQLAFSQVTPSKLNDCENSFHDKFNGLSKIIRKDDLIILRNYQPDPKLILADLHLLHNGQFYTVRLPEYPQFYFTPAKQMVVDFPDGKYCLWYKINSVFDDQIQNFEKMPSKKCTEQTVQLKASSSESDQKLLRDQIEKRIKEQTELLVLFEKDLSLKDKNLSANARRNLDELRAKINSWDTKACLDLKDQSITQEIQKLKSKLSSALPIQVSPESDPAGAQ